MWGSGLLPPTPGLGPTTTTITTPSQGPEGSSPGARAPHMHPPSLLLCLVFLHLEAPQVSWAVAELQQMLRKKLFSSTGFFWCKGIDSCLLSAPVPYGSSSLHSRNILSARPEVGQSS